REPCNEGDRFLIDFQSFMIEAAFFGRVHEVRLLISIVLLILFLVVIFLLILLFFGDLSWPFCRVGPVYASIEGGRDTRPRQAKRSETSNSVNHPQTRQEVGRSVEQPLAS